MPLFNKIKTKSNRIAQLEPGTGNNQPARASDVNPIFDWINNRADVTTAANTVTTSGGTAAAQTGTLNAISGTITSATLTNTANTKTTITVTNAYCTANSTVLAVISGVTIGTGTIFIQSVVPSAGSFQITLSNPVVLQGTASVNIKFIIL
jgi:hypothetical protein